MEHTDTLPLYEVLPVELIVQILLACDIRSMSQASLVCRLFSYYVQKHFTKLKLKLGSTFDHKFYKGKSAITFEKANTCATTNSSTFETAFVGLPLRSGTHYFEFRVDAYNGPYSYMIGFGFRKNYDKALHSHGWCYRSDGTKSPEDGGTPYGESYTVKAVIGMLINMDEGRIEFFKDGVSQGVCWDNFKKETGKRRPPFTGKTIRVGVSLNNANDSVTLLRYVPTANCAM